MKKDLIKDKAIHVIEGFCILWESGVKSNKRAEAFIGGIYRYSHLARGECKNPHADWLVELNQTYESFIKQGVISRCPGDET